MLIFTLSAAKTMRLLSSHILPRNASDFTGSYLRVDLKNFFPRGETPGPLLTKGGGGGKFLPLQEGEGRVG